MDFSLDYGTRTSVRTVSTSCEPSVREAEQAVERLRSWASDRGAEPGEQAFLRLPGPFVAFAHVAVDAGELPEPEAGISLDRAVEGPFIAVADVHLAEARPVARAVQYQFGPECGSAGPPEFHADGNSFATGTLVIPVQRLPAERPASIALPDAPAEPAPAPSPHIDEWPAAPVRVVTLARQHGTAGEQVARLVAARLQLRFVDWEVLQEAAREAGVSVEAVADGSRRQGLLGRIIESFAWTQPDPSAAWVHPVALGTSAIYTSNEYRSFVEDVIRDLAEQGNVLIVGHGAQLVLAGRPDTFKVLIAGSEEVRAARAMAESGMTREQALKTVHDADRERVDYFREFYDEGWLAPSTYDICINTDRITAEDATDLIVETVRARGTQTAARNAG